MSIRMMLNRCNPLNLSVKNARVLRRSIMMIASVLAIVEIILMILVLFFIESKRKITLKRNSLWKFVESKIQILIISLVKLKIFHCTKNLLQKKRTFMRRQGGLRKIILNVLQLVHKNLKELNFNLRFFKYLRL